MCLHLQFVFNYPTSRPESMNRNELFCTECGATLRAEDSDVYEEYFVKGVIDKYTGNWILSLEKDTRGNEHSGRGV